MDPVGVESIPGEPGKYINTQTREIFELIDAVEGNKYDTVRQASGAVTANQKIKIFDTKADKLDVDADFHTQGQVVGQSEKLLMEWIGIEMPLNEGANLVQIDDIKRAISNVSFLFQLGKTVIAKGPIITFPSGYGLAGQTVETATGVVSIGVPSTAAVEKLHRRQFVTSKHSVKCELVWDNRAWISGFAMPTLDAAVTFRVYLHGLIETASTPN